MKPKPPRSNEQKKSRLLKEKTLLGVLFLASALIFLNNIPPILGLQGSKTMRSHGTVTYSELRRLQVDGRRIVDPLGVEVRLIGCVVRTHLGDSRLMFTQKIANQLAETGFNTVKVLIQGEYIMPTRGAIDNSYFENYVDNWVAYCENAGLYCILCMYQDHWSAHFDYEGWGEGFPAWMYMSYPNTKEGWMSAVNDFYQGTGPPENNPSYLIDMWRTVASRYGNRDHVIFELLTEPLHYDSDLKNNIPAYTPLMESVVDALRAEEPFEHVILSCVSYGDDLYDLFSDLDRSNFAWASSEYDYDPWEWQREYNHSNDFVALHDLILARVQKFKNEFGKPLVASECGAGFPVDWPLYQNKLLYFNDLLSILEDMEMPWIFWRWEWNSLVLADGENLNQDVIDIIQSHLPTS